MLLFNAPTQVIAEEVLTFCGFVDVPDDHPNSNYITELSVQSVINGVGEGKFEPDSPLTREQFAKILVTAFKLPKGYPTPFTDLKSEWSKSVHRISLSSKSNLRYLSDNFCASLKWCL